MIKNYYGEKYAFEFAYLLHYQAWLFLPAFGGILLSVYSGLLYGEGATDGTHPSRRFNNAIDTELNAIFGIFVALWATLFVESWKR